MRLNNGSVHVHIDSIEPMRTMHHKCLRVERRNETSPKLVCFTIENCLMVEVVNIIYTQSYCRTMQCYYQYAGVTLTRTHRRQQTDFARAHRRMMVLRLSGSLLYITRVLTLLEPVVEAVLLALL